MFLRCFWDETGETRENPHKQIKNMQNYIDAVISFEKLTINLKTQAELSLTLLNV